jgi:hypothetical protein
LTSAVSNDSSNETDWLSDFDLVGGRREPRQANPTANAIDMLLAGSVL